jgi:alkane 1-monooxygenase
MYFPFNYRVSGPYISCNDLKSYHVILTLLLLFNAILSQNTVMTKTNTLIPEDINPSYRYYYAVFIPLIAMMLLGSGPLIMIGVFVLSFIINAIIDSSLKKLNLETKVWLPRSNDKNKNYMLPLYLNVPVQVVLTICSLIYPYENFTQVICAGVIVGISGGIIGLSTGHELIHGNTKLKRRLGQIILYCINYPYFAIEHMWHHLNLATIYDSDVARQGETVYAFFLRSIPEGWLVCFKSEANKLKRKNKVPYSLKNKMIKTTLIQVLIFTFITMAFGLKSLIVFSITGLVAILILKWADYIEHYGIERKIINGKAQPITRLHCWDTVSYLTNFTLMNLGYHGHHHQKAAVPYYQLEANADDPNTLPYGYTTLMIMALYPKYWFNFMEPYLIKCGHKHAS